MDYIYRNPKAAGFVIRPEGWKHSLAGDILEKKLIYRLIEPKFISLDIKFVPLLIEIESKEMLYVPSF